MMNLDKIKKKLLEISQCTILFSLVSFLLLHSQPVLAFSECILRVPKDYPAIQQAIDAAEEGCEIVVSEGTYFENIDFKGKKIAVRSTDPTNPAVVEATVIDGGGSGYVVKFASYEISGTILS